MSKTKITNFGTRFYETTLAMSAETYSAGDVITTSVEVVLVSDLDPTTATLRGRVVSLRVLDEDDQGASMDVFFLRTNVSLGTVGAAISISDANAREIVGIVRAQTYTDLINSQQADVEFYPRPFELGTGVKSLYVTAATRGAPTYTASGVRLQIGVELENQQQA